MGIHFYALLVVTKGNETNEYDIGKGGMENAKCIENLSRNLKRKGLRRRTRGYAIRTDVKGFQ
jgi:hypothetical protein